MGEIADSMINGEFDFYTGEYIGRPVGYPRTFDRSLPWEKGKKAPTHALINFLSKKGVKNQEQMVRILQLYAENKKWEISGKKFIRKMNDKIQEDFASFASWIGRYLKPENNQQ